MRGHLQCRDTLAGNEGCPLKTGTTVTTRQCNRLYMTRPRTTFSSNLPNHNFVNIWNKFDQIYQKCKPKHKAKKLLRNQFIDSYLNTVRCDNHMCNECNNNNINFDDKPILHIQSKIHSNLNTRTLSFVPKQSTVCICTHTAHLAYFFCTFSLFKYILYIPTMVSQEDG